MVVSDELCFIFSFLSNYTFLPEYMLVFDQHVVGGKREGVYYIYEGAILFILL